mmetsp:Transcript_21437/g.31058  ORF Transcript_21437/g.31058 Transcript_21437/m.31058 type:complete len:520 (+) Transcript_21437:166-1725(+)|eukprot:CAMPEP_0185035946 /NCGR_PEP_ID=MMETSP1103-20130426/28140_1 /TAXON_ID=36769 /ORGANISM="Paraphysomonas bandaiensis, Strain Caron Lab Isolate" /LENGTH=519 /DNA_ID=CAMNT_0027573263 /DNA_START=56 /DNA_END=1615 /DNA_ORIENTATION=+
MGAGASSINRLRKALIMRAYNTRNADETLEEQFHKHTYRKGDILYISIQDVKRALSVDAQWVDQLFERAMGCDVQDFEFSDFMDFLETGKLPLPPCDRGASSKTAAFVKGLENRRSRGPPEFKHKKQFPPSPPRKTPPKYTRSTSYSRYIPPFNADTCTIYPGTIRALGLNTLAQGIHSGTVVRSKGDAIALNFKDAYKSPHVTRPLWRKREVVRQERTIHYTTVDAEGVQQELVEREMQQTEVLHMECRETGEFAHRETTDYEQLETFNNEVVTEICGNEEYVHLKSKEDEFEYMESNMPKKEAPPTEEEPEVEMPADDGVGAPHSTCAEGGETPRGGMGVETDPVDEEGYPPRAPSFKQQPMSTDPDEEDPFYNRGDQGQVPSPSAGGWASMGQQSWVPPSAEDYGEDPHIPSGIKEDLFTQDSQEKEYDREAARFREGKSSSKADIWTADDDHELTSADFRDSKDDDEPQSKPWNHQHSADPLGETMNGHRYGIDSKEDDEDAPRIVKWGTEDDID